MFTAASFQHLLLDLNYLRQHGVESDNIEFDDYHEIAFIRDSPTAELTRFTGLWYFDDFDDGDAFFGYRSYVNGVRQGLYVRTYPDGALEVFGHQDAGSPDGTWYEFHRNGNLRQVSIACHGRRIAQREYNENGTMISERYDMAYSDPKRYMDIAEGSRR